MITVATLKPIVRCCKPESDGPKTFKLPKRLARARRVLESKRMENLKAFHEALVKASKDEQEFVKSIFVTRTDATKEAAEEDSDVDEE
jgi:hypothetical protein